MKKVLLTIFVLLNLQATSRAQEVATNRLADVIDDLLPSTVTISTNTTSNKEFGSGFIISTDGFLITNNHVISDAIEINVSLSNGEKHKAKLVSVDKKTDLALLKIDTERDLSFVKFGDSNKSRIGDSVIVIGNPFGLGLSVSSGIISAKGRDLNNGQVSEFIQTDAAINKGNSGGPMFNIRGELIGIISSIFSPSGNNIGIGFAIPSSTASQIAKQLKDQGEVVRGWIGVSVQDVSEEISETMKVEKNKGAFVTEVTKAGPADQAGILPTDIILKFDDLEISEMKVLPKLVSKYSIGKTAKITLLRNGKPKVISVKIEKMPEDDSRKIPLRIPEKRQAFKALDQVFGIGVIDLNPTIKKVRNIDSNIQGVLVTEVGLKSEAALKGLMPGDIILSVNQTPIYSIEDLKNAIDEGSKSNKKFYLFCKRNGSNFGIALSAK